MKKFVCSAISTYLIMGGVVLVGIGRPATVYAQANDKVAAKVGDTSITQKDVDTSIESQLFPLEQQIYALRKAALENLLNRVVLEQTARKRGISVEDLKKELTMGKIEVPSIQVEQLYSENAAAFGAMSPDEAKERVLLDLETQMRMKFYRQGLADLRKNLRVETYLEAPKLLLTGDTVNAPSIGRMDAAITIIEFSDFQCPYCRGSQKAIKQVLQNYKEDVRLVFRYLPLEIHSEAFSSAQAAFCANQQGLFWKYHDALFTSEDLLIGTLKKIAANTGLSQTKSEACLTSQASREAVLRDVQSAKQIGINGTPSFIVNGNLVRGAISFSEFKDIIERELRSVRNGDRSQ